MTTLVLQLLEAAAGCWTYLWLINRGDEGVEPALRLLNRTGIVVDGTGRSSAEKAALLATFGPSGIIAFDDEKLVLAAELAQHLGLLANSPAATMRLVNKIAQRKALQAAGLPVPAFWDVQATADIAERQRIVETVSYPVIVKPQADAGSRNTYRADEEKTLTALLDQASTSSGRAEAVIVEGLLTDGWSRDAHPYADFVSVESAVCEGRPGHFAVTGRSTLAEPYRATGSFIPSNLPRDILAEICSLTTEALLALDVTTGIYHTEVKLTRDGPRIIEVNGRVGGSIPELVSLAGGPSILELACKIAMGLSVYYVEPIPYSRIGYSALRTSPLSASRITRLDGLDLIGRLPGVSSVAINKRAGDAVDWREGYLDRLFIVYGSAASYEAMWASRRRIDETAVIEFE